MISPIENDPAVSETVGEKCRLCGHAKHVRRCEDSAPNAQFSCGCNGECPHDKDRAYCKQCAKGI